MNLDTRIDRSSMPGLAPLLHRLALRQRRSAFLTGWLLLATLAVTARAQDPEAVGGHWEGEIRVPGTALQVMVDLSESEGVWEGTIDIPMQGANGLGLEDVTVEGESVSFRIKGIPGAPSFAGTRTGERIEGTFTQAGAEFEFWLGREGVTPPRRPQDPEPPFPYAAEEVTYRNGDVTLAGTLTVPEGTAPFPAAILITGSGAQNRDEELLGHRPFLVLADHLTRRGIAVLRVDDRGVGGSSGSVAQSTSRDFATDVVAGVGFLRSDARIREVGVIGHSEGGLVGPLAATLSDDIAFVVMLAGTGVPGTDILKLQLELISRAQGTDDETLARQLELQQEVLDTLMSSAPMEERRARLRAVVEEQMDLAPEAAGLDGEAREQAVQSGIASVLNPWFETFLTYDPRETLSQVQVPVLALNGDLDLQVDADQNMPEIARALLEGGNGDVTVRRFPGMNHLFQTAQTGAPTEYSAIEETMSPIVLEVISDWILDRFGTSADE